MDTKHIINGNGDDEQALKENLSEIATVLAVAARDYATNALAAANEALNVAVDGGPCVQIYGPHRRATGERDKARKAIAAALQAGNLRALCEETSDPEVDDAYKSDILKQMRLGEVEAILEGVASRLHLVYKTIPDKAPPGARCDPSKISS